MAKRPRVLAETVETGQPDVPAVSESPVDRPKLPPGMPVLPESVYAGPPAELFNVQRVLDPHEVIIQLATEQLNAETKLHWRFVCRLCKRVISGCLRSCAVPIETHRVELVDCCAVCARTKKEDEE